MSDVCVVTGGGSGIALCKSCYSQIHAKRGDYWGGRG